MSSPTVHIFYIPGLGDGYDKYRIPAIKRWNQKGVVATHIPMNWRERDETYEQKLRRIQTAIRESKAKKIVLVGESAGGSMVINETLRQLSSVDKCITICGKNVRADRVSPRLYVQNPAFRASMTAADQAVEAMDEETDGKKFTLFYSRHDAVVWLVDTKIPGAKLRKIPMVGHILSILFVLYIYKNQIIKEAQLDTV